MVPAVERVEERDGTEEHREAARVEIRSKVIDRIVLVVRSLNHGVGIVVGHDCGMRLRALMTADAEVVLLRLPD